MLEYYTCMTDKCLTIRLGRSVISLFLYCFPVIGERPGLNNQCPIFLTLMEDPMISSQDIAPGTVRVGAMNEVFGTCGWWRHRLPCQAVIKRV
jgi:hypothetical protein